jgi:hypothetical protein
VTTISLHQQDFSDALYRRFATVVSSYFDQPTEAHKPGASVPLENLFRLLQMYRYNAFADERRSGVLAIEGIGEPPTISAEDENWHTRIQHAVDAALDVAFQGVPKDVAVPQLQSALTWLALEKDPPPVAADVRQRAKVFLDQLSASLT